MEVIFYCLATAIVFILVTSLYQNRRSKNLVQALAETTQSLRDLEKETHLSETNAIRERNVFEHDLNKRTQAAVAQAHREGVEVGKLEAKKDHDILLKELELAHRETIFKEREIAAEEAKTTLRADLEQQVKIFSVRVRPYVSVFKSSGLFFSSHHAKIGYQYQLYVNGIPAFSPHIIIENEEETKEANQEVIDKYIEVATRIAERAADVYLGGAKTGAVRISDAIVNRPGQKIG